MKKLFTLFFLFLTLAVGFTSCSGEAEDVDSVNKQTILVFIPWTGSTNSTGLKSYLDVNIDSIYQGIIDKKGLDDSRVLLFYSDTYDHSTLYDLQYDATKRTVSRVALKEYTGLTYNSDEGIADILNEVKQKAYALNYAMIIGGHGCGWTYADDWENYPNYARPRIGSSTSASANTNTDNFSGIQFGTDPNKPLTRFFGSVSMRNGSIDIATLANGIKQSGIKMQYILFDACYMGNVETAYELKDVANYVISSSSEVLADGMPYRSLWSYLNSATPNYTSIVSTVINYYQTHNKPYVNVAAIDCRQLDNLASVMKEINNQYTLDASIKLDSIQPLDGFSPHLFYDLKVYVDSLHPSGYLLSQFNTQLNATVKSAESTDYVITALNPNRTEYIRIKSYCGMSISDPSLHSVAIKGREKTGWWKATH